MAMRSSHIVPVGVVFILLCVFAVFNIRIYPIMVKVEELEKDVYSMVHKVKPQISPRLDNTIIPPELRSSLPIVRETNPIPTDVILNKMTVGQISDLFHGYVLSTQALCNRVLRMGKVGDGGWDVCDDARYTPTRNNCLVYSFGINFGFSFDDAVASWYGCEVHSYDPSMTNVSDHLRGEKVHFHRAGIGGNNVKKGKGWALYTLGTLRAMNHHKPSQRRVDIVKMDVEGAELPSLFKAIDEGSLKDVTQLSFETHMSMANGDPKRGKATSYLKLLRRLWDQGFRLYHANRNLNPSSRYKSKIHRVMRTACHELYMVNIYLKK